MTLFVLTIGDVSIFIDIWMVLALMVSVGTSILTCNKYINAIKREVAIPILILNWISMLMVIVCGINCIISFYYRTVSDLALIIIFTPWHIANIIKLNKRKSIPQKVTIVYCNACGTALEENTAFCTKCGNQTNNR